MEPASQKSRDRKEEALAHVCMRLAEGTRPHEIRRELESFGVSGSTVYRWFTEGKQLYGKDARTAKFLSRCRAEVLAGYLYIVNKAIEGVPTAVRAGREVVLENIPDLMLAKATYDSMCKMLGLNAPAQLDVTHSTGDERGMRDRDTADLQERLNILRTNGGERAN